ncbi:MAG: hypothetical protein M3229_04435, partial [Actinomycetota bacterium]|nr:hypothetical protein [Actinomycetota bacterium]
LAPYRVAQSTGHLLGPISALLALALLGVERARGHGARWLWLTGAALVALPLSGQLHLALGAIPFTAAYGVARLREPRLLAGLGAAAALAVVAGVSVQRAVVDGSVAEGGRTLREVAAFSADWQALVSRDVGPLEEFVLLGWAMPLVALGGLALLIAARRLALAAVLAGGVLLPSLLALGTNLPLYGRVWDVFPPLRYPRVPERLMPIACLALAALAAFAIDRVRGRAGAAAALALVAVDLRAGVTLYRAAAADEDNRAYAALAQRRVSGRLLELPVFLPERHYGSVYLYYARQAPRERPGGYSTVAPREADAAARLLVRLNCGAWDRAVARRLAELGVTHVAVHGGLYRDPAVPDCERRARSTLERIGFERIASDGLVTLLGTRSRAPSSLVGP